MAIQNRDAVVRGERSLKIAWAHRGTSWAKDAQAEAWPKVADRGGRARAPVSGGRSVGTWTWKLFVDGAERASGAFEVTEPGASRPGFSRRGRPARRAASSNRE